MYYLCIINCVHACFDKLTLILVWADNADFCANQYTGTGALKTDFTRYVSYPTMYVFLVYTRCLTREILFHISYV